MLETLIANIKCDFTIQIGKTIAKNERTQK